MVMAPATADLAPGKAASFPGRATPAPWAQASRPAQAAMTAPAEPVASNCSNWRRLWYAVWGVISLPTGW